MRKSNISFFSNILLLSIMAILFSCDNTITPSEPEPTLYSISIAENIQNGYVKADKKSCVAGETITLTVSPNEGFELDSLSVKDSDGHTITLTNNTFTMPESNVSVTASFKTVIKYYSISVNSCENGSVTSNKSSATSGETITLTVSPNEGFELDSLSVKDSGGHTIALTNNTFTMPESNVSVTASFKTEKKFLKESVSNYYQADGSIIWELKSDYNESGKIIKMTQTMPTLTYVQNYSYDYDENGFIIRETINATSSTTTDTTTTITEFTNNSSGIPIKSTTYYSNGSYRVSTCNSRGLPIKQITYNSNSKITSTAILEYLGDTDSYTKITTETADDDIQINEYEYANNHSYECIKHIFSHNGIVSIIDEYTYTYQLDSFGNLTYYESINQYGVKTITTYEYY